VSSPRYIIVWQERFERELQAIQANAERVDESIAAIEWALSCNPEYGIQLRPGSRVWAMPTIETPFLPPLIVYYTFDDNHVYLESVRVTASGLG